MTWAVPTANPVTTPALVTVATPGLSLAHVTAALVALAGCTLAAKGDGLPAIRLSVAGETAMPVTDTGADETVTVARAVKPPSTVVAIMVAVPTATPDTTPVALTATIAGALLLQVTAGFVAWAGCTEAVSVWVSPTLKPTPEVFNVTPVAGVVWPAVAPAPPLQAANKENVSRHASPVTARAAHERIPFNSIFARSCIFAPPYPI
nr:hypothetical protein [Burkholderia sp. Bp8986]